MWISKYNQSTPTWHAWLAYSTTKLVVNNIDSDKKEASETESIEQKCEKLEKQMKEVLMINKRGGRGRPNNPNIQCYQFGGRGHIRTQCRGGSNQRPRGRGNGFGGRGRGRGFPFQTRRGQFRTNFGANRGRPNYSNQFPIGDLTDQWDYDDCCIFFIFFYDMKFTPVGYEGKCRSKLFHMVIIGLHACDDYVIIGLHACDNYMI